MQHPFHDLPVLPLLDCLQIYQYFAVSNAALPFDPSAHNWQLSVSDGELDWHLKILKKKIFINKTNLLVKCLILPT
jgi:hypothetical protein